MRKDNIRDYATEAFRFFAMYGGYDEYKRQKMTEIYQSMAQSETVRTKNGIHKPTESQVIKAEEEYQRLFGEAEDVRAVERVIYLASQMKNGKDIVDCIRGVYFVEPSKRLDKGDIQTRVDDLAEKIYKSPRDIYRCLAKARQMFAEERCLRI